MVKCNDCDFYAKGDVGARVCTLGLWDERRPELLPLLDKDLQVLKPRRCKERARGNNGRD